MLPIRCHIDGRSCLTAEWVDDLLLVISALIQHKGCAGAAGGCDTCRETVERARVISRYVARLLPALGIALSEKGHQATRRGTSVGIIHDTFAGRFFAPEEKVQKILTKLCVLG
jgi:hypothetical protein